MKLLPLDSPVYLRRLVHTLNQHHVIYLFCEKEQGYRVKKVNYNAKKKELAVTLFNDKKMAGNNFRFFDGNGQEIVAERLN